MLNRMIKLDRGSHAPLYQQVKAGLLAHIQSSGASHDQPIPSERELAEMLKLSRLTVRRSIVELANEGFLRRIPGRGTFIVGGQRAPGGTIALVLGEHASGDLSGSFVSRLLSGIIGACRPTALSVRTLPDLGDLQDVRGLIALWLMEEAGMARILACGLPTVAYECVPAEEPGRKCDTLGHGDEEGACAAVEQLIILGHRDIACAAHQSPVARQRQAGYERAMARHGLPVPPQRISLVMPSAEAGYAYGRQLLADPAQAPTAVMCSDDHIAVGILAAAQEAGLPVPGFLSLVGYGDLGVFSAPAMASVRIDIHGSGRDAVRLLRERLADPALPARHHVLPSEFIRRASCGPPRRG